MYFQENYVFSLAQNVKFKTGTRSILNKMCKLRIKVLKNGFKKL